MLTFSLHELSVYISQKADGNFRQVQDIERYFQDQAILSKTNNSKLIHLQLENKNQLVILDKNQLFNQQSAQAMVGDAVLSNLKIGERGANKTLISMVLGDCFPLIFFDQKSKNMAMIHAGWEPLYLGILDKVWQTMLNLWDTESKQLWAFLGPGIRAKSYFVATKPIQSQDPLWQGFISQHEQTRAKKQTKTDEQTKAKQQTKAKKQTSLWQINLPAFIKDFLSKQGLPTAQLIDSRLDTYALDKEFFSYRRSQELLTKGENKLAEANNGRFFVVCQL